MNPINARAGLSRAAFAKTNLVADPGAGNVIYMAPVPGDLTVTVLDGAGDRTLQPAETTALGTRILVIGQSAGVTVNSISVGDGECTEFIVCRNVAGANEWAVLSASVTSGVALPADAGTVVLDDTSAATLKVDLLTVFNNLDTAGLIDASGLS